MCRNVLLLRQDVEIEQISVPNGRPNVTWAGDWRLAVSEPVILGFDYRIINPDVG